MFAHNQTRSCALSDQPTLTLLEWRSKAVSLYFGQRPCASIRFCHLLVSVPGPDPEIISLACIDYHDTVRERRQHFKPPPNLRYTDWPGLWRAGLLNLRYTPKEPEKDPFLVALIIALAQKERQNAVQPLPSDSSFTVGPFPSCFSLIVPSRPKVLSLRIRNHLLTNFGVTSSLRFVSSSSGPGGRGRSIFT